MREREIKQTGRRSADVSGSWIPLAPSAANLFSLEMAGLLLALFCATETIPSASAAPAHPPATLVITNAVVLTIDELFSRAKAIAVTGERIAAVGDNSDIAPFIGTSTSIIDARGKTVLPGLIDSHVHSYRASVSEFSKPLPALKSLAEAFQYIRTRAASQPPGSWIILERVYPTRLKEGRLPTKDELDAAAPN